MSSINFIHGEKFFINLRELPQTNDSDFPKLSSMLIELSEYTEDSTESNPKIPFLQKIKDAETLGNKLLKKRNKKNS